MVGEKKSTMIKCFCLDFLVYTRIYIEYPNFFFGSKTFNRPQNLFVKKVGFHKSLDFLATKENSRPVVHFLLIDFCEDVFFFLWQWKIKSTSLANTRVKLSFWLNYNWISKILTSFDQEEYIKKFEQKIILSRKRFC